MGIEKPTNIENNDMSNKYIGEYNKIDTASIYEAEQSDNKGTPDDALKDWDNQLASNDKRKIKYDKAKFEAFQKGFKGHNKKPGQTLLKNLKKLFT